MFIIIEKKFGKLRIKVPQEVSNWSNKKIEWVCECGKEKLIRVSYVTSGHTVSCGRCNEVSAEEISKKKFGKLQIKTPQNTLPSSHEKIGWICDCGKDAIIRIGHVISGRVVSCGKCNEISAEEVSKKKFGKLRIKTPQSVKPWSTKKTKWICDCGKEIIKHTNNVISGHTTTCGDCYETVFDWYFKNQKVIRSLKYPILPEQVPSGGITLLEIIKHSKHRFKTVCPACKNPWTALWNDIRLRKSLTCGCSSFRVSGPQRIIYELFKQKDPNAKLEFKFGSFWYDIFVPSKNLLIEYDGLIYHSSNYSKEKDLRKQKYAINNGYKFLVIKEKDWITNKKEVFERLREIRDS